jgi:hypothetical protein
MVDMDGFGIGWAGALVSVVSACAVVAATVVTVLDGRAARRNTEFLAHRDLWWQRWSWVADRTTSLDVHHREAAMLMVHALTTRDWVTDDDKWVLEELERREFGVERQTRMRSADDLGSE